MEIFELIISDNLKGVQAISLVEQPAIESNWITLSKEHQTKLAVVDNEKRILMGAALIPNKTIYRRSGDNEYYIYFSKDTIRKASELFFQNSFQSQTTLDHVIPVEGNTVVESWIVEDIEKDKTKLHGIEVPVGTWMVSMKVEDDMIWEMAKNGEYKGFSIEGSFVDNVENQTKKTKNSYISMNKKDEKQNSIFKEAFEALKKVLEPSEIQLASEKLDNGTLIEAESFEAGQPIFIVGEDENIPLPVGEYEWAGKIIVVTEDGVIAEIKEAVEEGVEAEFVTKDEFNSFVDEIKSLLSSHVQDVEKIESENTELKADKETLEVEKVELQKKLDEKPDAKKVKPAPKKVKKPYNEMSNYEKLKYNEQNGTR